MGRAGASLSDITVERWTLGRSRELLLRSWGISRLGLLRLDERMLVWPSFEAVQKSEDHDSERRKEVFHLEGKSNNGELMSFDVLLPLRH